MSRLLVVVSSIDVCKDGNIIINGEYVAAHPCGACARVGDLIELTTDDNTDAYLITPPRTHTVTVPSYTCNDVIMSLIIPTPYDNIPLAFLEHPKPPGATAKCVFVSLCAAVSVD